MSRLSNKNSIGPPIYSRAERKGKMTKDHPELSQIEQEAVTWVRKLVSGEIEPDEVTALNLWRARSPEHEASFIATKRVWQKVGTVGLAAFGVGQDFSGELDAFGQRKIMSRRAMMCGGAAMIAAVSVYAASDPPYKLWPSLAELMADYRTATGEQRNITFADEVAICLNTQTSLAIRPAKDVEDRVELISGEASFAMDRRRIRTFAVLVAEGKSVAESGRFDVRYTRNETHSPVSVTCFEGTVRIECGAKVVNLRPGQRVHYDRVGFGQISTVDSQSASDWQRGIVEFHDTSLTDAVEEINRYRPGRIILMNDALSQKQISGRFHIDQMNQILEQLQRAFSAKLQRLPGDIVLLG